MAINMINRDDKHGYSSYILSKKKPDQVSDQAVLNWNVMGQF